MSSLIPNVSVEQFIEILKTGRISELKSCTVADGENEKFTAVIFHGDINATEYQKAQAESLGERSNIGFGVDPEELLPQETAKKWRDMNAEERAAYQQSKREAVLAGL